MGSGLKRCASSPPSPVLDLPPMRFIAIAKVVCASRLIEPKLIAPVAKPPDDLARRLDFVERHRLSSANLNDISPRIVRWRSLWSLIVAAKARYSV